VSEWAREALEAREARKTPIPYQEMRGAFQQGQEVGRLLRRRLG
jgi:hypothetical protein